MNNLQKRIKHLIESTSLLNENFPIVIGVSGGADSISLLHILSSLFPATKRIAVYVDHGLRPDETEAEKKSVERQAQRCSAHFVTIAVDVLGEQQKKGCSIEEAARNLRYQALEKILIAHKASMIAVGHTADDQAEELLLRLIRGSGVTGLSGMNLRNGHIIRPLLHETKEALLSYLKEHKISFCEDSSNSDKRFLRNKIRLDLLPTLEKEYNKSIRKTLLQTATILDAEDKLLEKLANNCLLKLIDKKQDRIALSISGLLQEPLAIQRRILDKICWMMDSKPSFKKIEGLLKIAVSENTKELHLSSGLRAIKENESLIFLRPSTQHGYRGPGTLQKNFTPITIEGIGVYPVASLRRCLSIQKLPFSSELLSAPKIQIVDADTVKFPLLMRHAAPGEYFQPLGAPGNKKISRFLSDQKVPVTQRDQHPIILSGEKVVAIAGLRIDNSFRITDSTQNVLSLQWQSI